jgi:hypothetical protein
MDCIKDAIRPDRREAMQSLAALAAATAVVAPSPAAHAADVKGAHLTTPRGKPLRGLYPIVATPFTEADKLEVAAWG